MRDLVLSSAERWGVGSSGLGAVSPAILRDIVWRIFKSDIGDAPHETGTNRCGACLFVTLPRVDQNAVHSIYSCLLGGPPEIPHLRSPEFDYISRERAHA